MKNLIAFRPDKDLGKAFSDKLALLGVSESEFARRSVKLGRIVVWRSQFACGRSHWSHLCVRRFCDGYCRTRAGLTLRATLGIARQCFIGTTGR